MREVPNAEIVHYADCSASDGEPELFISSYSRRVSVSHRGKRQSFALPHDGFFTLFSYFRLARRTLRLDKCNIFPLSSSGDVLIAIRQGMVYRVELRDTPVITPTLRLSHSRNILHQGLAQTPAGYLYFGEYASESHKYPVHIYRSADDGCSWEAAYKFLPGIVKHVHACYWDPIEKKIWVCTGDSSDQCRILCANESFTEIEEIAQGAQLFRTTHFFFKKDAVYWIMDSPLETNYLIRFDRRGRTAERLQTFPGPVWFAKTLTDGWYVAATVVESGPGVTSSSARLFASPDANTWHEVAGFAKDGWWPKWLFKDGVIGFADGPQSSSRFYLFCEALRGCDGKSFCCSLEN